MRDLWRVFAASKIALALSIVTGVVAGASSAWLLTLVTRALDNSRSAPELAVAFLSLCLVAMASSAASLILLSRIAQSNLYGLRLWLSRCILAAPLPLVQSLGQHRLMAALTSDIESVVVAQEALPNLFIEGSKVIAVFVYLWLLSPILFLIVAAYVAACVVLLQAPQLWALRWLERARQTENSMFNHFRAATQGSKELKMNARRRHAFLQEEVHGTARMLKQQKTNAQAIFILVDRCAEVMFFALIGVIIFAIPDFFPISSQTSTGFVLAILFLGGPLSVIGGSLPNLGKGVVALRNIESMGLNLVASPESRRETAPPLQRARPEVLELIGVTYRYDDRGDTVGHRLGPITARLSPGDLVFITGENGSGKTTLALLILGLFAPCSGEIRLAGELVTDANRESYRQNFSAVFADSYCFDVLIGYASAAMQARARELLVTLKLENKLRIDQGRFSTVDLSTGERKRLSLLAAYLEDRAFYLFDEWAAEQDPQFREAFYRNLLPELKARGKTVIVISHDDRYFHLADRVLRVRSGQLETSEGAEDASVSAFASTLESP